MQGLEVENQVEFADILEEAVERLDKDLDKVEQGKRRFGGGADDNEVERRVVAIGDERGGVVVRRGGGRRLGGAGEEGWEAGYCQCKLLDTPPTWQHTEGSCTQN